MQRAITMLSTVAALALAVGCGSGSSPTAPDLATVEIGAPKADITVSVGPEALSGPSLDPGYTRYVRFTASLQEAAGLGAHLDYVRGDFYADDAMVDRYDFTGAQLVEQTGSNRLEAGAARSVEVVLRWRGSADLIRTTFHFTDDKGHEHHLAFTVGATSTAVAG